MLVSSDRLYDRVGEMTPSEMSMAHGLTECDGEGGIEEEDSLLCPVTQIAIDPFYAKIGFELCKDIFEAWREASGWQHTEGESMSYSWCVVWVLSEDDDAYIVKCCEPQGFIDFVCTWGKSSL